MNNSDIRAEIMAAGLKNWQIAAHLGTHESVFSRKLRHELPDEEKAKIRTAIKELSTNSRGK